MKTQTVKAAVLAALALAAAVVPGCWDATELDALSIVAGMAIDVAENKNDVDVTVQIGKAGKEAEVSGGGRNNFIILDATGKTVLSALERLRQKNSRDIFLHHNQIIVISSERARKGIEPLFDLFLRDHETRLEVWVLIAENTAKEVLEVELIQERITAVAIARIMENQSKISPHLAANLLDIVSRLVDKGTSTIAPIIDTVKVEGQTKLLINGLALFDDDKMVGRLSAAEVQGFLLAMGHMKGGALEVPMDEGTAVLPITAVSTKVTPVLKDDTITIKLEVDAQLVVGELVGFENIKMLDLFPRLEEAAQRTITRLIKDTFEKTQQYETDIYGYGLGINRKYPKEWKDIKDDWDAIYASVTLDVTTKATVLNTGKIADSMSMRGEE